MAEEGWIEESDAPAEKVEKKSKKSEKSDNQTSAKSSEHGHTVLALIEREPKTPLPLVLYILSLVFVGAFGVLLALNNGAKDLEWTIAIHDWVVGSPLATVLIAWPNLIGGSMAFVVTFVICLVIVVLPKNKTKKVVKYAGIFVMSALIGLIINRVLMGLSTRVGPTDVNQIIVIFTMSPVVNPAAPTAVSPWYNFLNGGNANSWMTGSFTSFTMTFAGIIIAFPYCFNSAKTKALKVVTAVLALVYMVFMGLGLIATYQNWLSDVIFAGVLQYWIVAMVARKVLSVREQELMDIYDRVHLPVEKGYKQILQAKSILDYSEVAVLLEKVKKVAIKEEAAAKKTKEKGKEVAYLDQLTKMIALIDSAISKMPADKIDVPDLLKEINGIIDAISGIEKSPKTIPSLKEYIDLCMEILADNKVAAMKALEKGEEYYHAAIEAAKIEPGDFGYIIEKSELWLKYIARFKEGLAELKQTSGTEFQIYMKENFLYII
jgi:hypothetical protein